MTAKKPKQEEFIFAVIDADDKLIGYFPTEEKAIDAVEREALDEAVVLKDMAKK